MSDSVRKSPRNRKITKRLIEEDDLSSSLLNRPLGKRHRSTSSLNSSVAPDSLLSGADGEDNDISSSPVVDIDTNVDPPISAPHSIDSSVNRTQQLHLFQQLSLHPKCTGWQRAYEFFARQIQLAGAD
jgi:hypothetical protein